MATGDKKTIRITGRVIDRKTKQGLSNLRVEAWDKDSIVKNSIGSAITDPQGAFVIEVAKGQLNDLFAERHVLLFFKVFREGQLIASTEASVLWDRDAQDSEIVIKVTFDTSPPSDTGQAFTVNGQVRHADGSVFTDGTVRAFVAIQGPERLLGETRTDSNGQFEIAYTLDESQVSQLANVRVLVRVFDSKNKQLAESPSFIPDTTVTVNVTVPNPPPPPDETLSLRGRIRNKDGNPVAGAIVRAFITSSEKEIPIGEAQTDSTGRYVITATVQSLTTQPADARLEARVFDKKNTIVGASTSPVQERVSTMDVVADFPDPGKEWCAVSGQVFQKDGKPLGSGIVRVYGAFPAERALANATATITAVDDGRFRIEYQPAEFSPRISEVNRVEVRVFRVVNNQEQELVQSPSSPVQFRADEEQSLNIHLGDNDVPPDPTKTLKVSGLITEDHAPLPDAIVRAFDKDFSGTLLGATQSSHQTSDKGHYEITYTVGPAASTVSHDPNLLIAVFTVVNNQETLRKTSAVVPSEGKNKTIDVDIPVIPQPDPGDDLTYTVVGTVTSPDRAGVNGLQVQIVDKNVGPDVFLAQTVTNEDGSYKVSFVPKGLNKRCKQKPDLQARAYAGSTFLAASEVRYYANTLETLNVFLPADSTALPSEWETLIGSLAAHCAGRLSDLKESGTQQDITYLANKTGWDARAVALAALADQFSRQAASTALPPFLFYALFRTGLPAEEATLYHTDEQTLENVWNNAVTQGVIPKSASAAMIGAAITQFQIISAGKLLTGPALIGVSPLNEMLTASGLDSTQQAAFAKLYAANRSDIQDLWDAISKSSDFDVPTVERLQVDGRLGFLTINNAPLMTAIHTAAGDSISDPLQLAKLGYYDPGKWNSLMSGISIPPEISGAGSQQQDNYAEYLAAQVRLSYPTASVAHMVQNDNLLSKWDQSTPAEVQKFLNDHQGEFDIGRQPIRQYVNQKKVSVTDDLEQQVSRLQRVLQITPSDQAMVGLMTNGIDSAYHVVGFEKDEFIRLYQTDVGSENAAQIYDKSVQVHNAALNIAISYLTAANGIGLGAPPGSDAQGLVIQPAPKGATGANAADLIAYPTLEGLFGEMDFCACDHCRSVLSPAAYLVDLLLFLDRNQNASSNPPGTGITPLQELLSRRPDLEHLPLSCENTNTALPYIDVVNETLEYFVANTILNPPKLSMDGYIGHDTADIASEDLMASPQFVMDSAYNILRGERFPIPLPFHQPLESLRRYFEKFEVPLPLAMERLRKNDAPERSTTNAYGWLDILMEELHLSRDEKDILTRSGTVPVLWRIYGFPDNTSDAIAIADLSNAKFFARRVGITYEELVAILQTRFVNPSSDLVPKLQRLGVSFATLQDLKSGAMTGTDFDALLPKGAIAPDPAAYGGDIKQWVRNNDNFKRISSLITLTDLSSKPDPCNFDHLEFRFAMPNPSTTQLTAVEFFRLIRFIRLWKKLGWTIEQTDAVICALYRTDLQQLGAADVDSLDELNAGFLTLLPRLGIVVRVMKALNLTLKRDLLSLLTCWSDIGTHGESALYRQMFHNPTIFEQDRAFMDNGFGEFLWDNSQRLLAVNSLQTATVGGSITINDVLTTSINGVEIPYQVVSADTTTTILATHIVSAINATITPDPDTGTALNEVIKASNTLGVIHIATIDPGSSIKLACSLSSGATETYAAVNHEQALRAAFNLTGAEFTFITNALGFDAATFLNLTNISAVYRNGWLARKLRLSVREFVLLMQVTGLDPFAAPDPIDPAILRLIELVQALKDRSLKPEAALYLIWNQDLSGRSTPDPAKVASFARTLRRDFAAVETEFAIKDDPDGAIAQARMALVYGADAAAFFFGLLNDTLTTAVPYTRAEVSLLTGVDYDQGSTPLGPLILAVAPALIAYDSGEKRLSFNGAMTTATRDKLKAVTGVTQDFIDAVDNLYAENQKVVNANLEQGIVDVAPGRIAYDDFRKLLSYAGVLTETTRDRLMAVAGLTLAPQFNTAVGNLYAKNRDSINPFFARYAELKTFYDAHASEPPATRRSALLNEILPDLLKRRKAQQALQAVSAAAQTDLDFARALLDTSASGNALHAAGDATQPALNDLLALETEGLTAQFFANDTASGTVIPFADIAANLDYRPLVNGVGNPLPNPSLNAAISGIWSGHIEAPESGFFNLLIETDTGASVKLKLDGEDKTLTPENATLWQNSVPIELRAGTMYAIELKVEEVRNIVRVQWEWEPKGGGRTVIPPRYLYPASTLAAFQQVYIRFLKASALATSLGLTAGEMAHFGTHSDYRINSQGNIDSDGDGWLNVLPNADNLHLRDLTEADKARNLNAALLAVLRDLLDYARIKAEISPGDETLLKVLKDPADATASADSLLFNMTRWNRTSLNDLLAHFGESVAGLTRLYQFRRVYDAFALIQKMGIPAGALIKATTNEPGGDTVRDLQAALRARYDVAAWRDVVQPINDTMRGMQRDALVAYILHRMRLDPANKHIDTADKLFEYFLMDVQMEPCMQTSRIRHALSSVQLFIERCLMSLEPSVDSRAINAKQWEWMKRYRVWEANRKVFLFPENWLEPELRDDKSPFFKEIESELLQSDITEDSATSALLNYLSKLEEVAKLEPCGIYHVPADLGLGTGEIDHIIARTAGAHRKYYYRRFEFGYWTPWEQIKLDIEDNPVIPYVWNGRLLLFWLKILKQAPLDPGAMSWSDGPRGEFFEKDLASSKLSEVKQSAKKDAATNTKLTVQAILCWSEYYNGKWQTAKTSDVQHPATLGALGAAGDNPFDRSSLYLSVREDSDTLWIDVSYPGLSTSFHFYNTHSLPVILADEPPVPGNFNVLVVFKPSDSRVLDVNHASSRLGQFVNNYYRGSGQLLNFPRPLQRVVLEPVQRFKLVEPRHHLQKPWDAPFFYQDSRHVFFVTTAEQSVRIYDHSPYGFVFNPHLITFAPIPPLFFRTEPPPKIGPQVLSENNMHSFDVSVVNPGAIRRFVTEDAYIHVGLGTTGEVRYGDSLIGPAGAIHGAGGPRTV